MGADFRRLPISLTNVYNCLHFSWHTSELYLNSPRWHCLLLKVNLSHKLARSLLWSLQSTRWVSIIFHMTLTYVRVQCSTVIFHSITPVQIRALLQGFLFISIQILLPHYEYICRIIKYLLRCFIFRNGRHEVIKHFICCSNNDNKKIIHHITPIHRRRIWKETIAVAFVPLPSGCLYIWLRNSWIVCVWTQTELFAVSLFLFRGTRVLLSVLFLED